MKIEHLVVDEFMTSNGFEFVGLSGDAFFYRKKDDSRIECSYWITEDSLCYHASFDEKIDWIKLKKTKHGKTPFTFVKCFSKQIMNDI